MDILWTLLIGGVAGWGAGQLMKGRGFGLLGNILVGVAGGVVGGLLFNLLDLSWGGLVGRLVSALVGAVVLLMLVNVLKKQ